jgi:hypothetical protein
MKTKLHIAAPEHEVAYQDLVALVRKHAEHLSSVEMLAVAANMLGKLVAMQDQRMLTPAMAMELVAQNIEEGNRQAIENIQQSKGNA